MGPVLPILTPTLVTLYDSMPLVVFFFFFFVVDDFVFVYAVCSNIVRDVYSEILSTSK